MQAALLAVVLFAADSQLLPRAELDQAIKAAKHAELGKAHTKLFEARKVMSDATKVKGTPAERREAINVARAHFNAVKKEFDDANKAPGMVPHIGYENLAVGQVGKLYYRGHVLGPFVTQPDGEIRGKDDAWHDFPVKARVSEVADATTLRAEYKGVSFKVKTDTARYKIDDELRLDVPLKVTGVDRTRPDAPVWEIRFFIK